MDQLTVKILQTWIFGAHAADPYSRYYQLLDL